ncbi:uncharacterized protein Dana_GF26861, partial [Drosophila ananassae]
TDSSAATELARENLFQPNMDDAKPATTNNNNTNINNNNNNNNNTTNNNTNNNNNGKSYGGESQMGGRVDLENQPPQGGATGGRQSTSPAGASAPTAAATAPVSVSGSVSATANNSRKRHLSNSNLVNDLEILDRELSAINAPMLLIDPEITQGAEQLEKISRKRLRSNSSSEDESDRLVREALSQFYIPPQRLISAIEECPLDVVGLGMSGMGMGVGVGVGMGMGGVGVGVAAGNGTGIVAGAGAGIDGPSSKRSKLSTGS